MTKTISRNIKKKKIFLEQLKISKGIIAVACERAGIARATYYLWISQDEKFKESCEEIREYVIDFVESKLLHGINNDDMTATIFYLKTIGKNRGYVERLEQNVTVNPFMELMQSATSSDAE